MVSVVCSFIKSWAVFALLVLAFAGWGNAAEPESNAASAANAELVAELAVRDSVMAVRDSACTVEKQSLHSELEIEKAKCENWEQSYNTLKKNNETCAKALGIAMEASQEQAEKQKAKENSEKEQKDSDRMMMGASMAASFGLGMLIMWLIID
jgi:isoleucyl-tRNA synthetase